MQNNTGQPAACCTDLRQLCAPAAWLLQMTVTGSYGHAAAPAAAATATATAEVAELQER